ncbi:hypothetical protein FACS1894111_08010 [Clostridia bacterium]|nr:hypothetical protein FACS1894111_08010 [Clostridia bacterium]
MASYTVGDMIRDIRKDRGYTQEILCDQVCSVSTLSRIENSEHAPSRLIFDSLMQKLGIPTTVCSAYISKQDMELYRLTRKITGMISHFEFEYMADAIAELEGKIDLKDAKQGLEKQYLLFVKAIYCRHTEDDLEKAYELLVEAIRITIPKFNEKKPFGQRKLLTYDEMDILSAIGCNLYDRGEQLAGLKILKSLMSYLEQPLLDVEERAKRYPMMLYNLVKMMESILSQRKELIKFCTLGIDCCVEYGKLQVLPYLMTKKASAIAETGDLKQAKPLYVQAISLLQVCKQTDLAKAVRQEAEDKYHLVFRDFDD